MVIAANDRLAYHVQKLRIGDERIRPTHPTPKDFITGLQRVHVGTYETPSNYSDHTLSQITCEDYQKITIQDFLDIQFPDALIQIGVDRHKAYTLYKAAGDEMFEHLDLLKRDLDITYLGTALSNLKNLRTVHLSLNSKTGGKRSWGAMSYSPYVIPRKIRKRQHRQLLVFLQVAAALPTLNISHLQIDDNVEDTAFTKYRGFGFIPREILSAALPSLQRITRLDIPIGDIEDGDKFGNATASRLAELLRRLPLLENFTLRNNDYDDAFRFDVIEVLDTISSRQLQSIDLERCLYQGEGFKNFLEQHSPTLREIRMHKSYLNGCTFRELFTFMHDRLALTEFTLDEWVVTTSFDDPKEEGDIVFGPDLNGSISRFVIHKSDEYPSDLRF